MKEYAAFKNRLERFSHKGQNYCFTRKHIRSVDQPAKLGDARKSKLES